MDDRAPGRRLAWSTAIFSLATGVSRVVGLVREIFAAYYFGTRGKINAFTVAFAVPNLVRALVADAALSSAFVPVFSELLESGDRKRAWRVASSLFWLMLLGLGALSALFIVLAPWVLRPFGDPGGDAALAVGLSRVLFPIVALLGVSGIVVGILNSYEHFTVPALTPIFWNLAIIVGLVVGVPRADEIDAKLYVYAVSILIGTLIQVLLPMPWLRGLDGRLHLVIDWRDPAVARTFRLMLPVTLGLGLININALVDQVFASRLIDPELAPTAIDKAFRVYMLPQGMFSVAIATVLFPSLARLAEPMIRLLYQRGAFGPTQTPVVAGALAAFSAGLVFNGAMLMLNRAFFSLQLNWLPTAVALSNLVLNALLDFAFYRVGVWGIPLATAAVNIAGTVALLVLLRRRIGLPELRQTGSAVVRITIASLAVAVVGYAVWWPLDDLLGRSLPAQVVSLASALVAATVAYLGACWVLRVREMQALLSLRGRPRRA